MIKYIKRFFNKKTKIDTHILPSQGIFYKDDFEIRIKKASKLDIIEYENNYIKDDIGSIINGIKRIVEKNVEIKGDYDYNYIKSIDIIFIFLEIVKITKGEAVKLSYSDRKTNTGREIEFDSDHFNYFRIPQNVYNMYDSVNKCFDIHGYKYSLPSIGVENSLTDFLISKYYDTDSYKYNEYNYDFTYFVYDKDHLNFDEIENLIYIFNNDIDDEEMKNIKDVIEIFTPIQRYSLKKDGKIVDINSKINLGKIWK